MKPTVRRSGGLRLWSRLPYQEICGSGSPETTAGGQPRETRAERQLLNRSWSEEKSWNKARSEHVSPRTPALQGWEVSVYIIAQFPQIEPPIPIPYTR